MPAAHPSHTYTNGATRPLGRRKAITAHRCAARHASAETLVVAMAREGDAVVRVSARDDGRRTGSIREGNGLRGLRERFEELGGSLEIVRPDEGGLMPRALAPTRAARS